MTTYNHITAICRIGQGVLTDAPGPIAVKIEQALKRVLQAGDDRLVQVHADPESGLALAVLRSPNASGCDASLEGARRGGFLHAVAIEEADLQDDWSEALATQLFESRYGSPLLDAAVRQEREILFLALPADGVVIAHLFVGDGPEDGGALYGAGADAYEPPESPSLGLSSLLTSAGSAPVAATSFPIPPRRASAAGASVFAPGSSEPGPSAKSEHGSGIAPSPATPPTVPLSASSLPPAAAALAPPPPPAETLEGDTPRLSSLFTSLGSEFSPPAATAPLDFAPDSSEAVETHDSQAGVVVPFPSEAVARQLEVEPESLPPALHVVESSEDPDGPADTDAGDDQEPDVAAPESAGFPRPRVFALAASLLLLVTIGSVAGIFRLRSAVLEPELAREVIMPADAIPPASEPESPESVPTAVMIEPEALPTAVAIESEPIEAVAPEVAVAPIPSEVAPAEVVVEPEPPEAEAPEVAVAPVPREVAPSEVVIESEPPEAVAPEVAVAPVPSEVAPAEVVIEPEPPKAAAPEVAVAPVPREVAPAEVVIESEPPEAAAPEVAVAPVPREIAPAEVVVEPEPPEAVAPEVAVAPVPSEVAPSEVVIEAEPIEVAAPEVASALVPSEAAPPAMVIQAGPIEAAPPPVAVAPEPAEASPALAPIEREPAQATVSTEAAPGAAPVLAPAVVAVIVEPAEGSAGDTVAMEVPDASPALPPVSSGAGEDGADTPIAGKDAEEEPRELKKKRNRLMRRLQSYR